MPFYTWILAYLARGILRLLVLSCRFRVSGGENLLKAAAAGPCIIALWHDRLLLIGPSVLKVTKKQRFCAFISKSRDGDLAAAYTCTYAKGSVIRVPHDQRSAALQQMKQRLRLSKEVIIATPDGPRGPRHQAKIGCSIAAYETGAQIIPFSWHASRCITCKSWDRFCIPLPFSTIEARFGPPLTVSTPDADTLTAALQQNSAW